MTQYMHGDPSHDSNAPQHCAEVRRHGEGGSAFVVMVHLNYMTEQNARRGRWQDRQFSGIIFLLLDSRESVDLRAISRNTRHFHVPPHQV